MILHEEVQNNPRLPFYFYHSQKVMFPEHWHQGIELNYLIKGQDMRFAINGHTYHFNSGDMWAVNHNLIHSQAGEPGKWDYFGLIIDDDFLLSEFPASKNWHLSLLGKKSAANKSAYHKLTSSFIKIDRLMQGELNDIKRLKILQQLYEMIILLNQYFNQKEKALPDDNQGVARTIILFINQHFADNLNAAAIASQFGISQMTLNKQLKQNTGMTLAAYLKLVRLMHARQELLGSEKPIEVIANEAGFSNSRVFSRNFKDWKQKTPSEYRNAFKKYYLK